MTFEKASEGREEVTRWISKGEGNGKGKHQEWECARWDHAWNRREGSVPGVGSGVRGVSQVRCGLNSGGVQVLEDFGFHQHETRSHWRVFRSRAT